MTHTPSQLTQAAKAIPSNPMDRLYTEFNTIFKLHKNVLFYAFTHIFKLTVYKTNIFKRRKFSSNTYAMWRINDFFLHKLPN